jgi:protein tyrosine phosphatase (PTP) superfamily phosphohydrolase (DUF442 family)
MGCSASSTSTAIASPTSCGARRSPRRISSPGSPSRAFAPSWPLQREACERLGLTLVEFKARSRGAPERETILKAKDFFDGIAYPALIHCKSGADRAGLVAALYLIVHEGRPVREALSQLSLRYGHFRFAKTGILDAFFERYLTEGEPQGLTFLEWAERVYDPDALERDFRPSFWPDLLVDRILRRE